MWCRSEQERTKGRTVANEIAFEFGETKAATAFWDRNITFWPAFVRMMTLVNRCFGRPWKAANRMEEITFHLGETCRQDFLEIAFLAVNGHGVAAQKLLRGLFERAVTLEYIRQNPEKAERFVRFAAIQEFRAAKRALEVVTLEQFDSEFVLGDTSFAKMKALYEQVVPEFQTGKGRVPIAWDIPMASMTNRIGEPYKSLFLYGYTIPTLQIHATLASAFSIENGADREERNTHTAELSLIHATLILLAVLRSQSEIFALPLDEELEQCLNDVTAVWRDRSHGPLAKGAAPRTT